MRLGISTYSFPWNFADAANGAPVPMQIDELIQFAVDNNISHVQFGDNVPLHMIDSSKLDDLVQVAKRNGVVVEVGMRGLRQELLRQYIRIANSLSSPFLRVVIDDEGFHPDVGQVIDEVKAVLPELVQNNIVLAIENHDRFASETLREIIFRTSESQVAICLDTANSYGALEGTYETVEQLAPYTINLHIKDISIKRVASKMGFHISGAAAGEGDIDIPRVIRKVKQYSRCVSATLELWSDFEHDIVQTRRNEKEAAKRSIQFLKQHIHD